MKRSRRTQAYFNRLTDVSDKILESLKLFCMAAFPVSLYRPVKCLLVSRRREVPRGAFRR